LSQEKLEILVKDYPVKPRVLVGLFLPEESTTALDYQWQQVGLEDGLVSHKVGQSQSVDKEDVADKQEVNVRTMGWQEHDWQVTPLLDGPDLFQHLLVDTDLLVESLEGLVKSVGHASHHWYLHLCYQLPNQFLGLLPYLHSCLVS
jgi:hypothetical protein